MLQRPTGAATQDDFKTQFFEAFALILSAESYPQNKLAMQEVFERYPAFAEAARHMQIIADSLAIIETTKNRKTLESRVEVVRTNQAAMYDALPFKVDADARAAQDGHIDQVLREGLARLPIPSSLKEGAAANDRRALMRERREQMLLNTDNRPLWQLRAAGNGRDPKACSGIAFPVYRWDDPFWRKNGPWVCRKKGCLCYVRAYRLDETPMLPKIEA